MNHYLPLGGPAAVSWHDVIATVQHVLGREVAVQSVGLGEPVPGLPEVAAGLMSALETYDSIIDMTETARTFGVQQTTLEEFIRQAFTDARTVAQ